jgi:hypothetical protein
MYKKTVTYTDFSGVERTEDFFFNLTKAELLKMEIGRAGTMTEAIEKIVKAKDTATIVSTFENLVLTAYGEKSEDGKRFMKSDEIREAFKQTQAYSDIFMELASDDDAAAEFINNIVPADMAVDEAELKKLQESVS